MTRRYTTQHQPKKHLSFDQRLVFEQAYNDNLRTPKKDRLSKRKLADFLGLPFSTFLREEARGLLPVPNTFRDRDIRDYSATRAQDAIDAANMNKGRPMSMTNVIAKLLQHQILDRKRSPYDALLHLREQLGEKVRLPSLSSGYNHIRHGDIGILPGQTPYHPDRRTGLRPCKPRRAFNHKDGESIEDRPDISLRREFGHWEMDIIVSCVGGKGGVLVLIERKTRRYIVRKLAELSSRAVCRVLRKLLRSGVMGRVLSITTDNGREFLPASGIEALFREAYAPFRLFYTHAYAAWEKGSVENCNRIVRRWYPKGTDFARVSAQALASLEAAINGIHRRSLGGLTAAQSYARETA